jgi:hypothetical protein
MAFAVEFIASGPGIDIGWSATPSKAGKRKLEIRAEGILNRL